MYLLSDDRSSVLLGTGEGIRYDDGRLNGVTVREGVETLLFRAMCEAEYDSIVSNANTFVPYDWALEKKWFATCYEHAVKWADWFYPDGTYRIAEITVLRETLKYMFYVKLLDNIGPAYSADVTLLNMIVRGLKLV